MTRTLHRTPAPDRAHHALDFLHGIDLERVHVHRPRGRAPGLLLGALALLAVVGGLALLVLFTRPAAPTLELSAHDSGIAQAVAARDLAREVTPHDSGIAQAVVLRDAAREVTAHDSGIAQAVALRAPMLEITGHDSGIAQALAVRDAAREVTPHDSGIELALRSP
jgi:hypothetical protein